MHNSCSNLTITTNRQILGVPKSIQASVTLLENLHIIVEKTPVEDLQAEIFPMLFSSYESTTLQVQVNYMHAFLLISLKRNGHGPFLVG